MKIHKIEIDRSVGSPVGPFSIVTVILRRTDYETFEVEPAAAAWKLIADAVNAALKENV